MTKPSFRERLQRGAPILADGAMGTVLHHESHARADACFDAMNVEDPEIVLAIHKAYVAAGADLIETNTFGANSFKLGGAGRAQHVELYNRRGVELARLAIAESENSEVYIAGSVGPLGVGIYPYGRLSQKEAKAAYAAQLLALLTAGCDAIQFETFSEHKELLLAISVLRELDADLPIIAQATFYHENLSYAGYPPARVANDLYRTGADVIGVNCGSGPAGIAEVLRQMRYAVPDAVFSAMPNAGFPEVVGGRILYPATAEYFADCATTFVNIGATVIGGCCGTTPEHIAAMRRALDQPSADFVDLHIGEIDIQHEEQAPDHPTELSERLAAGQFTVTVEMAPPRSYHTEQLLAVARRLRAAGADLINVADTPAARMKMSAWAVAHLLQTQLGIETVLHFPTRGRNMLRVQGDLLASHALGLRNLFVVMGDPTRIGDFPDASDLSDVTPSRLIDVIKQGMNRGVDMAGHSIGYPSSFTVGCALNMGAEDIDREVRVLRNKLKAGADFALGQAIFDPDRIRRFHQRYEELTGADFDLPVLMAVMPLHSLRQARFLNNEVPGITIPDSIIERIAHAGAEARREGVVIAQELLDQMSGLIQGAYIIPGGDYDLAAEVVAYLKRGESQ
ncbi:MAG: bifunctional homocysteine S-methyltransferase/methylenetetrahydrofolate reductase [Chloroflexota bacterium]|nr:bifunctional homocysteine S-methyltransferase/methylenetetrahydrofolate reductase [Chloroflexota bacterium]